MGQLKYWMLEQSVKTKGCSSICALLREFCWGLNYDFNSLPKSGDVKSRFWFFKTQENVEGEHIKNDFFQDI